MQPGNRDAVITKMRIRDDEVKRLREKFYYIRNLVEGDAQVFKDTPIGERLEKIYEIVDSELWPG